MFHSHSQCSLLAAVRHDDADQDVVVLEAEEGGGGPQGQLEGVPVKVTERKMI